VLAEKTRNLSPPHRRVGVKIAKKSMGAWEGEGILAIFGGEQKTEGGKHTRNYGVPKTRKSLSN
jgi:hypothetical protein